MKLLYFVFFAILPSIIFAQTNYHPGYVLKNNGDTLKGYIDYREWTESPKLINFKISKDGQEVQQFDPKSINGFGINGMETYSSFRGLISNDLNHFPDIADHLDTSKKQADIFLKLVTSGNYLSFYSQAEGTKARYFISEKNTLPSELHYNQYYNEEHRAIERPFFKGQLIYYINKYQQGNKKLISLAEEAAFESDPIEEVVNKINGDTSKRAIHTTKTPNFRLFAGAGVARVTNFGYNAISIPQATIGIDKFDNPYVQQWIFRNSVSISFLNANIPFTTSDAGTNKFKYSQFTISLAPQILYNLYNTDNLKIYVGMGASLNLSAYGGKEFTSTTTADPNQVRLSGFWVGIPFQTGVAINKNWELSFTYAPYTKYVPGYNAWSNHSLGLGAKFYLR
jgi:hypothetical protein